MKKILLFGLTAMFLASCSSDITDEQQLADTDVDGITAKVAPYTTDEAEKGTRTTLALSSTGMTFNWEPNDEIRIIQQGVNDEVLLKYPTGTDANNYAVLTGQSNPLVAGKTYKAVYAPGGYSPRSTYTIDFDNQTQTGNGGYSHLSSKDILVSNAYTVTKDNNAHFTMNHACNILRIIATLPKAGVSFNKVTIGAVNNIFTTKATLNPYGSSLLTATPDGKSNQLTLNLSGVTASRNNDTFTGYIMIPPVSVATTDDDSRNEQMQVWLHSSDGLNDVVYYATPTKDLQSGHISTLQTDNQDQFVDLRTSDGYLWDKCNYGATSIEGYGNYTAWGGTSDDKPNNLNTVRTNELTGDYLAADIIHNYQSSVLDKYYTWQGETNHSVEGCTTARGSVYTDYGMYYTDSGDSYYGLNPDHIAGVYGSQYATPQSTDFVNLISEADNTEWVTYNGVQGVKVSKGAMWLFFPAAGAYDRTLQQSTYTFDLSTPSLSGQGSICYYWTSDFKVPSGQSHNNFNGHYYNTEYGCDLYNLGVYVGYGRMMTFTKDNLSDRVAKIKAFTDDDVNNETAWQAAGFRDLYYWDGLAVRPIKLSGDAKN